MEDPPLGTIPVLSLHHEVRREDVDAATVVTRWLLELEALLAQQEFRRLSELFIEDSWWRDVVALTWDITSKQGPEAIGNYLAVSTANLTDLHPIKSGGLQPALVDMGGLFWIQSGFTFKGSHGHGRGFVRLANVGASRWKAWLVFTQLEQFPKKIEHQVEVNRHPGTGHQIPRTSDLGESDLPSAELEVLIVGAGTCVSVLRRDDRLTDRHIS
jgi:hypothetical protein